MSKVIAVLDNGKGKRGSPCDDCGTLLRYEYHTGDGGLYGSCCVHRHVRDRQGWLTFKAKRDAEQWAAIQKGFERQYPLARQYREFLYTEFSDGGCTLERITRYGERGGRQVVERLIEEGWEREPYGPPTLANGFSIISQNYLLRRISPCQI